MMDAGCDVSEDVTVGVVIQVGALIGILGISDLTAKLPVTVTAALLMCFGIIAMTVFSLALSQADMLFAFAICIGLGIDAPIVSMYPIAADVYPVTRHPSVTASAAATLQQFSRGRFELGVGRGDSALANLGYGPVTLAEFRRYLVRLQGYLHGEEVPFEPRELVGAADLATLGYRKSPTASKVDWLPDQWPSVPVNVAATGPKVTTMAAKLADVVTVTVPAVPQHLSRAVNNVRQASADRTEKVRITALLNVCPHHDEKTALTLASGVAASLGRLVVMQDSGVGVDDDLREEVLRVTKRPMT